MDTIEIKFSYKKEDLKCVICLDYLNNHIYQCPNGPHFVCDKCNNIGLI